MAPRNKILNHPDKNEIMKKLANGEPVRVIADWLKKKYPKRGEAHLRPSHTTIQKFKKEDMNLHGQVLQDVKEAKASTTMHWVKKQEKIDKMKRSSAYQELIEEAAQKEVDTQEKILNVFTLIEHRLESIFNAIQSADFIDHKLEKDMMSYLNLLLSTVDKHKVYIEGHNQVSDTNINVTVVNDQILLLREALRQTLHAQDPSIAIMLMEKINYMSKDLNYSSEESQSTIYMSKQLAEGSDEW